jgi:hypothetical protein
VGVAKRIRNTRETIERRDGPHLRRGMCVVLEETMQSFVRGDMPFLEVEHTPRSSTSSTSTATLPEVKEVLVNVEASRCKRLLHDPRGLRIAQTM